MNESPLEKIYMQMCKYFQVEFIPEHLFSEELRKIKAVFNPWIELYNKLGAENDERIVLYRPDSMEPILSRIISNLKGADSVSLKWEDDNYLEHVKKLHPALYEEGFMQYSNLISNRCDDVGQTGFKRLDVFLASEWEEFRNFVLHKQTIKIPLANRNLPTSMIFYEFMRTKFGLTQSERESLDSNLQDIGFCFFYGNNWKAFDQNDFYEEFKIRNENNGGSKKIYDRIVEMLQYEQITDKDRIITNFHRDFHNRIKVNIFIVSFKYIICLCFDVNGLENRIEHIIKRDIKRLKLCHEHNLYIYYHGLHDPQIIYLENYEEAINLQKFLTKNRESTNQGTGGYNQGNKRY